MKNLLLFALLLPFSIKAQQLPAANHIANKTTSTPLRLLAITSSNWSGTGYYVTDSFVYTYSGSRTTNFDVRGFNSYSNFDSLIDNTYDTAAQLFAAT